jgi:NAD(P)-dependent dehydrogenase (short-subunit alcohol dehydrogenase family)
MNTTNRVALVTGASRGIGKAIAQELGQSEYKVYLTGRTREGQESYSKLPGSIDETARLIEHAGGQAVAVPCDHSDDQAVEELFSQIADETNGLDLLVNNAWSGYSTMQRRLEEALAGKKSKKKMIEGMEAAFGEFTEPFWTMSLGNWDEMSIVGVRSHYVASVLAARSMVKRQHGLIVNITADISQSGGQVAYSMAKSAINRMTVDMAEQLRSSNVATVAIQPGMVLTEMYQERYRKGFLDANDYKRFEAPAFVGKIVANLAASEDVLSYSGKTVRTSEIGKSLEVPWLDGSHVDTD